MNMQHLAGKTIIGDVETVYHAMFGPQQHDAHMTKWRFITKFYGSLKHWHETDWQDIKRIRGYK